MSTSWRNSKQIQAYVNKYNQLSADRRSLRYLYLLFQVLIALFILFVATWIALILAKQISVPISALLEAAGQVRKGNLGHRVNVPANDEMATLVRGFNEMIAGAGRQQPRVGKPPPVYRSDSRKHSHGRDLADFRTAAFSV